MKAKKFFKFIYLLHFTSALFCFFIKISRLCLDLSTILSKNKKQNLKKKIVNDVLEVFLKLN